MRAIAPRVVVVGAGAIGLCTALALAQRGARVRVLDAAARIMAPAERSASARAAGLLGPFSELLNEPAGAHPGLLELGLASLRLWRGLADRLTRGAPERLVDGRGALVLIHGGAFGAAVRRVSERARRLGSPTRLVGKAEIQKLAPAVAQKAEMAVLLHDEAQILPPQTMVAMLRALKAVTGEEVRAIEARGLIVEAGRCVGVRVKPRAPGDPEEERADAVVLTPGVWTPPLLMEQAPELRWITPMKGHLIQVEMEPGAVPMPVRAEHVYMAPRGARLLRVGATMEPGKRDHQVDPMAVQILQEALAAVAPSLAGALVLSQWAGVRAMSPDWAPLIGPAGPSGCFLAGGHSRNGWLLAPITAEIIAAQVFEEDPSPFAHAFRPDRFDTH